MDSTFLARKVFPSGIRTDEEHQGRTVAVVLGAIRQGDVTLHPGKIPLPGFDPKGFFTIRNHLGDDAASGYVVAIDQDKAPRGLKIGVQIKGEWGFGLDGDIRHLVSLHDDVGLLLIQREVIGVHDAMNRRHAAFDFVSG